MAATLFSTMRDEAPFVLEWVAYHMEIGFDRIIVFSNDCTDGTDQILASLAAEGLITHVDHAPSPDQSVAEQVAEQIRVRRMIADGDWAIWLDADEFLNIHPGDGRVDDLITAIGDARGMCISWRVFGDAGQDRFPGAFLAEPFDQCAVPGEAWQNVKTFFRYGPDVIELFQHKPILAPEFWDSGGRFLSSSGAELRRDDGLMQKWVAGKKRGKIAEDAAGWQVAQINHYAVRTKAMFDRKQARGRIGEPNSTSPQRYNDRYFRGLNLNGDRDRSILRWADKTRARAQQLSASLSERLNVPALIAKNYPSEFATGSDALDKGSSPSPAAAMTADVRRYQDMHKSHHDEIDERRYSNHRLAELIYGTCNPNTVVDVGCGIGLLLSFLQAQGAEVTGLEGLWLDKDSMILPPETYIRTDLEQPITLDRRFDVACCIEVAEHLEPDRAESFVADLCALSDVVVFSAAIGGQGGKGHKNEQWQEYWCHIFEAQGYRTFDPFRETLRRDPGMLPWFQQNVLVFIRAGHPLGQDLAIDQIPPETANMILPTYHRKVMRRTKKRYQKMVQNEQDNSASLRTQLADARVAASAAVDWPHRDPNVLIATCMKDEGPFILEWVAWHKSIGIDNFVVYTNHCTDGTDLLLDRLQDMGELRHLPNPALAAGSTFYQPAALNAVPGLPEFQEADFFISMDVDEFVNIRVGDGALPDLLTAAGPFDALSMTELNHGSNGRESFEPGFVMDQFPNHQTMAPGKWKARRGVKTIVRVSDRLDKVRNHRPDFRDGMEVTWLDGSGRPLQVLAEDRSQNGIDCRGTYEMVTLDHFPLRSLESFLVKMFRGDVVIDGKRISQQYWRKRNQDAPAGSGLNPSRPAFRAYFDKLVSDRKLKALHDEACNNHAARIASLLEQPEFKERKNWILNNAWQG